MFTKQEILAMLATEAAEVPEPPPAPPTIGIVFSHAADAYGLKFRPAPRNLMTMADISTYTKYGQRVDAWAFSNERLLLAYMRDEIDETALGKIEGPTTCQRLAIIPV